MLVHETLTVLRQEHRALMETLQLLEGALGTPENPDLDLDALQQAEALLQRDLEEHLQREENDLFPWLEPHVPQPGPLSVMLQEHTLLRQAHTGFSLGLQALRKGQARARSTVREIGGKLVQVFREHMLKEDRVLFPLAERVLAHQGVRAGNASRPAGRGGKAP